MSDLGRLYQATILEHNKAPRHAAPLPAPSHRAAAHNPLCGDRVALTLDVAEGRVRGVGCEVKGCAICRASGSLLAEAIAGREVAWVLSLGERFLAAVAAAPGAEPAASEPWGPLAALLEARRYPNRQRCATLPWEALESALGPAQGAASRPESSA